MKKTYLTYGKKALSVFLSVLMLMTCWVFVAPEEAEAATNITVYYPVTVNFNVTTKLSYGGNIYVRYYKINDDGTLDTASGLQTHYLSSSLSDDGYSAKKDGYTLSGNVPGFPADLVIQVASDTWSNPALYLTSFWVGPISVLNGWQGTVKEQTRNWAQSAGSMDNITWNWPNPSWVKNAAASNTSVQVPAFGTRTSGSVTATFKDANYNVDWPQNYVSYSINGQGATLNQSNGSTSVSVTNKALNNFTNGTGTANLTLTASGAGKTSTSTVTLNAPKKDILYENLFSLSDWYYSESSRYTDPYVITDPSAGTIKIYKPSDVGEYTTVSSYPSNHDASRYAMEVVGGKEYYVEFTTSNSTNATDANNISEIFLFWYDANGAPVNNVAGSSTFNNARFTGNGKHSVTFTAPASATQAEIRFDNDTSGSVSNLTFSNISIVEKERADAVDLANWPTRPAAKAYTYKAALGSTLAVPSRIGHDFAGWYLDNNGNGINDNGDTVVTDGNGTVVNGLDTFGIDNNYILRADWTKTPYDIGYDNLFSLAEWSKTGSKDPNSTANGTITYDVDAGTITAESTANGEVYSKYGGAGDVYQINVEPETNYIFEADMDLITGDRGQMFVFFYDANGNGLTGANDGAITQPHIGIYLTSEGANSIKFKTPANCTKMGIRIGATTVGTKATYSDIKFMKQDAYDAYAKNYVDVREPFYYGDTNELSDPPARDGYAFNGWVDGEGNPVTSVSGMHESDTVYATWVKKYKVTFLNAIGETFQEVEVISGNKLTADKFPISNPGKTSDASNSYTFDKWMYNGAEFTTSTDITGDITVTPSYTPKAHGNYKYTLGVGGSDATCESNAKVKKVCGNCNYDFGIVTFDGDANAYPEFMAKGHYYEGQPAVLGSSNGDQHIVRCSRYYTEGCGGEKYVDHEWSFTETTGATCSVKGTNHYTCPCQATMTEEGVLAPSVHVNTEKVNYVAPTCLTAGKDYDTYCNDCQTTIATGATLAASGHKWENTKTFPTATVATCTEDAVYWQECSVCNISAENDTTGTGTTWTDTDSALGHDWIKTEDNAYLKSAADCENDAVYYYDCSRCDASSKDNGDATWTKAGTASGHTYTGTIRDNNNGTHSYLCVNGCGTYGYEAVKDGSKACTYGEWDTTAADTHSKTCTECNYVYTQAHAWSAWTSTDENKAEAGEMTRYCTVCNKTVTNGCNYEVTADVEETCETDAYKTYECKDCGHGYTVIGNAATGHSFTSGTYKYNSASDVHQQLCANGCGLYGVGTEKNKWESCSWTYTNKAAGTHTASCACGNKQDEACTGGTATCTEPATCEKCNTFYGSKASHSFKGTPVVLDGDKHAYRCEFCNDQTIYGVGANQGYTETCSGGTATCTAAAVCTVCGDSHGEINPDNHKWINPTNVAGTETHTYTCQYNADHTKTEACYSSMPSVASPDCNTAGFTLNICDFCNHTWKTNPTDAIGHDWSAWVNNGDGTHTRTCERGCGYDDNTETVSCSKDNATYVVTPPTCIDEGYTTYTCKACGYVWEDDEVPATGHSYSAKKKIKDNAYIRTEKTCTVDLTYWYKCDNCDVSAGTEKDKYADETALYWVSEAATGHDFSKKNIADTYLKSAATCTDAAVYYYSCSACNVSSEGLEGEKTFTSGAPLGHAWENTEKYLKSESDCVNDEVYYKECSRCHISSENESGETWTKADTKSGHDFDHDNDGVIGNEGDTGYTAYKDADCENDGVLEHYACKTCGKKYADEAATTELDEVVISSLGHKWESVPYKAATCDEDGHSSHKECTRCGEKNSDYKLHTRKGHNFSGAWYCDTVNNYHAKYCVNDDCTEYGIDGVKYSVEYDGLDYVITGGIKCVFTGEYVQYDDNGIHSHKLYCECGNETSEACADDAPVTVAPTCTEDGYIEHTCDDCGYVWQVAGEAATGHKFSDSTAWTSSGDGKHFRTCENENCNEKVIEDCSTAVPETECGKKNVCDDCNAEYGEEIPHSFTNYVYDENSAKCQIDGTKTAICDSCKVAKDTIVAEGTALEHVMTEGYVYDLSDWDGMPEDFDVDSIIEPTCHSEGMAITYCKNEGCDYYRTKTMAADKDAHIWETDADGELVWTYVSGDCSTGLTLKNICIAEGCNKAQTKTVAGEHKWVETKFIEPLCTKNGYREYKCTECQFILEEYYGMSEEELPVIEGVRVDNEDLAATGIHRYSNPVTVAATCTANEYTIETCIICRYENITEKDGTMLPHELYEVKAVEADCDTNGHNAYEKCVECELEIGKVVVPATGHNDDDGNGKCDECNYVLYETDDGEGACGCICHKDNWLMRFIYKILNFFWKLFKISKSCNCGHVHW